MPVALVVEFQSMNSGNGVTCGARKHSKDAYPVTRIGVLLLVRLKNKAAGVFKVGLVRGGGGILNEKEGRAVSRSPLIVLLAKL